MCGIMSTPSTNYIKHKSKKAFKVTDKDEATV